MEIYREAQQFCERLCCLPCFFFGEELDHFYYKHVIGLTRDGDHGVLCFRELDRDDKQAYF